MESKRKKLHQLLDQLPEDTLDRSEQALNYCLNPTQQLQKIDRAKQHVKATAIRKLEEHSRRTGRGVIAGVGSGSGSFMPDGDYCGSMTAWDDDGPVTYHLRSFRGHIFEVFERLELTDDATRLVLKQRVIGPTGQEQLLMAVMPVSARGTAGG